MALRHRAWAALERRVGVGRPAARLHEVRRFDAAWEREASVRLRDGDLAAAADYDRHGRIRGADEEAACDRAATMWLADHLRGKDVLLLAGSNAEAAGLSRRVQARLAQMGRVGPPQAALSDDNQAGAGDLVRARLNTEIDAGGRALTNRDTLQVTAFRGPDAEVRRQRLDGSWTGTFPCPGPTSRPAPSSPTPATSTSPRAAPSTPPTSSSPTPCPGRPCTSA
jgi:hypothetical protein